MIALGFIGIFFKYYMQSDRNPKVEIAKGSKIKVALWMKAVVWAGFFMIAGCLVGAYYEEDENVKQFMVPFSLMFIWFPVFGIVYYSSLYIRLTDEYIERSSILGTKKIPYDQIIRVESLQQGMYAIHLNTKKRIVFEPIFEQSPKIKSYLQDIAYGNRSRARQKRRSRS